MEKISYIARICVPKSMYIKALSLISWAQWHVHIVPATQDAERQEAYLSSGVQDQSLQESKISSQKQNETHSLLIRIIRPLYKSSYYHFIYIYFNKFIYLISKPMTNANCSGRFTRRVDTSESTNTRHWDGRKSN
jgi:hypothetical protein